jgi:RsiW-degrading membrane proteinase PrsW (M82 family)
MIGAAAALFVCFVWLRFIRNLDVFEPEQWRFSLLATALGAVSTGIFLLVLYFTPLGELQHDNTLWGIFKYNVLAVGLPEELTKFLPLFVMIRFTNQVDEPYDFFKYALCSALGFATVENIIYYNSYGAKIIDTRAYISVLGHMAFTSCAAYGYIRKYYFHRGNLISNMLIFGGLGVLLHGIFNFLLSNNGLISVFFRFAFVVYAYFIAILLRNFLNMALNFSPWFSKDKIPKVEDAVVGLGRGLILVFVVAALAVFLESGWAEAYDFVKNSFFVSGTLALLVTGFLGEYNLKKGLRINLFSNMHLKD